MPAKGSDVSHRNLKSWSRVIVLNGDPPRAGWRDLVAPDAIVIAADGGALFALDEGVGVHCCVGDFDSLDEAVQRLLSRSGTRFLHFPRDKNESDFALALTETANTRLPRDDRRVLVVGGAGGRFDHVLGNVSELCHALTLALFPTAIFDGAVVQVINGQHGATLVGQIGDTVSLVPVGGDATGVSTKGLVYELEAETLYWGASRGISNQIRDSHATVQIRSGNLILCEPDGWWSLSDG